MSSFNPLPSRPISSQPLLPRPLTVLEPILPRMVRSEGEQVSTDLVGISEKELRKVVAIMDPKLFAQTYLQATLWDTQAAILDAIVSKPRVAVKSCHSSSKSFTSAIATLWFLARYDEAIVVTTAPTWKQVEKILWGEIHAALEKSLYEFPKANQTELRMGPKRYAYGLSTTVTKQDEGVNFQGIHARNVLIIMDEAPGVNPKIWEAIEGARAGGNVHVLAIGNPTMSGGPFQRAFTENRSGWECFTIDAFDTPNLRGITLEQLVDPKFPDEELDNNVCPYLITRRWVRDMYFEYGVDHPFWESRVRGQFPKQSPDSLLSLTWLEEAKIRELPETEEVMAGLDVAGPGEAETSLTIRSGPKILFHQQWPHPDPRGEVVIALNEYRHRLKAVNVDCIGVGWGMYQHLLDLKFPALPINVCEVSNDSEKFVNIKSEFYWGLRLRLQQGDMSGLADEKTIGQLASIRYKPNSRGQIEIESKQDAIKRGVRSPDRAESLMLAFSSRSLLYGALIWQKELLAEYQAGINGTTKKEESLPDSCPVCFAKCVGVTNGRLRCGMCGHQWSIKKISDSDITTKNQFNRTEILNRVSLGRYQ